MRTSPPSAGCPWATAERSELLAGGGAQRHPRTRSSRPRPHPGGVPALWLAPLRGALGLFGRGSGGVAALHPRLIAPTAPRSRTVTSREMGEGMPYPQALCPFLPNPLV